MRNWIIKKKFIIVNIIVSWWDKKHNINNQINLLFYNIITRFANLITKKWLNITLLKNIWVGINARQKEIKKYLIVLDKSIEYSQTIK